MTTPKTVSVTLSKGQVTRLLLKKEVTAIRSGPTVVRIRVGSDVDLMDAGFFRQYKQMRREFLRRKQNG